MRLSKILALTALLVASPAAADSGLRYVPLGYCQLATLTTVVLITACPGYPTGATRVVITPEAQAIRYRDDKVAPTASVGMPMAVGQVQEYTGTIAQLQFIEQTAGGKVNLLFYR